MSILNQQDFQQTGWLPIVAAKLGIATEVLIPNNYCFTPEVKQKAAEWDAKNSFNNAAKAKEKRAANRLQN